MRNSYGVSLLDYFFILSEINKNSGKAKKRPQNDTFWAISLEIFYIEG